MMRRVILILLLGLFLGGCAAWTQLEQRVYQEKARGFKAELPKDWMRFNLGSYFLITRDGTVLDMVTVERHRFNKKLEHTKKEYFEGMTLQELAEIEIDNFKSSKEIDKFEIIANQPQTLDGRAVFRLEYTLLTKGGLKKHGIFYGFIDDKWIYRIRYEAADQHYFSVTQKDFERFIQTFQVI